MSTARRGDLPKVVTAVHVDPVGGTCRYRSRLRGFSDNDRNLILIN